MSAPHSVAQWYARWHERRLYLASHPIVFCLAALSSRLGPIKSIPGVGHVVCDVTLAKEVLSAPERFSKTGPGAISDTFTLIAGTRALVNMDGEEHRLLRALLRDLFSPRNVSDLVARVFEPSRARLQDELAAGESVDVVRLAQVLAGRIVCTLVGLDLPAGQADEACLAVCRKGLEFASVISLGMRRPSPARIQLARQRFEALTASARTAFDGCSESNVPGRLHASGLTFEESRGVIGLLMVAGTETMVSALPRIVAMLIDTGQWPKLLAKRELVAAAVDEGLRLTAPLGLMTRNVVETTVLAGRRLEKNDRVVVCLANALKSCDAAVDPLYLNIERSQSASVSNLWFGHGPHFCLGAALARTELQTALNALLDCGALEIAGRRCAYRTVLPAYAQLLVRGIAPVSNAG